MRYAAISERLAGLGGAKWAVHAKAKALAAQGHDIIKLTIGEPDVGDLEILPLTSINDRGFRAFQFNPLSSFRPSFPMIEIVDVYQEVAWYAPKLKNGQMLCVPIDDSSTPDCVYFVKDVSRNCEIVNYNLAW